MTHLRSMVPASVAVLACLGFLATAEAQMMGTGNGMMNRGARAPYGMMGTYDRQCAGVFGGGYGGLMPFGYQDPAAAAQAYLARLHDQLGITVAQEPAWQAFAAIVVRQAQSMLQLHQQMFPSQGSALVWTQRHADVMQQRAADAQLLADAVADLYEALSVDQRATLDTLVGLCAQSQGPGPFR